MSESGANRCFTLSDEFERSLIRNYFEGTANVDDLEARAESEVGEKQRWKSDDIFALRDLIKKENTLKPDFDDIFLLKCLRSRLFDYENAYDLIKNYNKLHVSSCHLFVAPHNFNPVFDENVLTVLPKKTDCDETILLIEVGRWNCLKYDFDVFLSALISTVELLSTDVVSQICGIIAILDMSHFNWTQLKSFSPIQAKKLAHIIEEALPFRLKAVHVVNDSLLTYIAYSLLKPFLTQELRSRIEFHKNNLQSIHRMIPQQYLPSEIGGNLPFDCNSWFQCLLSAEDELIKYWKFFGSHLYVDNNNVDANLDNNQSLLNTLSCRSYVPSFYK